MGTFDTLIPLMPSYIGVLAVDLPGHGRSSHLPDGIFYQSIYHFGYSITLIMKKYDWSKVSILAHSMSSIIGFIYAAIYPDKVDLFIGIDFLKPMYRAPVEEMLMLQRKLDRFQIADERHREIAYNEPPSFTYDELKERTYEGYRGSIDKDKLHHILDRNITRSERYPDKYYFSRDDRLKCCIEFVATSDLSKEMATKIKAPYLLIKGGASMYVEQFFEEIIEILRKNNPNFESFFLPEGTHHLHLNNPDQICSVINTFIEKHRPRPDQVTEKKMSSPSKL